MSKTLIFVLITLLVLTAQSATAHAGTSICGSLDAGNLGLIVTPMIGANPDPAQQDFVLDDNLPFLSQLLNEVEIGQLVRINDPVLESRPFNGLDGSYLVTAQVVTQASGFDRVSSCAIAKSIDAAKFVKDISVPDGTPFAPNAQFTKTWRLQNTGDTTWTSAYRLVLVSGDRLGASGTVTIARNVRPGETVDLSVALVAPATKGSFTGKWKLANGDKSLFGPTLSAVITVQSAAQTGPIALPSFKLPYSKNEKVYWTGGPHAFLTGGDFGGRYPSGLGSGMDFANRRGFEVLSMAAGKVIEASCKVDASLGCIVAVKHTVGGSVLVYGHLQPDTIAVSNNQSVKQGTVLGLAGQSGRGGGSGIHLHIELRDGSGNCSVQCMPVKAFGNPIGWDDLVQLVDGWRIGGYLNDSEGKESRNYDGSAVLGDKIDVLYYFPYVDFNGRAVAKGVRVARGFKCAQTKGAPNTDCELPAAHTNPGEATQFARDDGKGAAFPSNQTSLMPSNGAGSLRSTNTPVR